MLEGHQLFHVQAVNMKTGLVEFWMAITSGAIPIDGLHLGQADNRMENTVDNLINFKISF